MTTMTHYDGSDVIVLDALGARVSGVAEVQIEFDRAVLAVRREALAEMAQRTQRDTVRALGEVVVYAARGCGEHWRGPVRVVAA